MPLPRLSDQLPRPGQYTNPAQYNRWLTFYSPGQVNSGDGTTSPREPVLSTWGSIRGLAGEELDKAQQIAQESTHLCTVPYQIGIGPNMLVEFEGRFLQIKYPEDPDEKHQELRLYCAEIGQGAGSQT